MMVCSCGNLLDPTVKSRMNVSPCRCDKPGSGHRVVGPTDLPDGPFGVSRDQYEERARLGLPPITEYERSFYKEMK